MLAHSLASYSTQFLFDPPIDCFPLVRSAYFLSAETPCNCFFLRQKQFCTVESIDRISYRSATPPLKIFPPTLRSYVSLLLSSILFCVPPWLSSLFIDLLYSFRRARGRSDESGRSRDDPLNQAEPFILHHAGLETRRVFHL